MMAVIHEIFADGRIYLMIYVYLAVAMVMEATHDSITFSRWIARLSALLLIAFIGLRWETGTDWKAYFTIFYANTSNPDYDIATYGIDKGYVLLNHAVREIWYDYSAFLIVDAAIAICTIYYFIEKSTSLPNMGVYLFYTSYAITHFMGSNRRMLAIGLVGVGFASMIDGERLLRGWRRWILPFGLAAMFHRTSIMALPGLIVSRRAWPTPAVVFGLLACVGLGMSGAPFSGLETLGNLLSQYAHVTVIDKLLFYTSGSESQSAADFDVMGQALLGVAKRSMILVILIPYMRLGNPSEYAQRLYNIYVLGCAIYFLMIGSPVFQVISTYYTIVEVVLLPIIFSHMPQYKIPYLMYLVTAPFLLMASALSPYMELYIPYRSIFTTY